MRKFIKVISYVLSFLLMLGIIAFLLSSEIKNKIVNRQYIEKVFDKEEYYQCVYDEIQDSVENYYYQSGLEHKVLENLYDIDRIKSDSEQVLDAVFRGTELKIDKDSIKNKLNDNINLMLEEQNKSIDKENQKAVEQFVNTIADTYESEVSVDKDLIGHISKTMEKIKDISIGAKKVFSILFFVFAIGIILLNIKKFSRCFKYLGIAFFSSGLAFLLLSIIINSSIKVNKLYTLSTPMSKVVRSIGNDILSDFGKITILFSLLGIVFIIINAVYANARRHSH